jgi:ketosteroid isomerase-like protein
MKAALLGLFLSMLTATFAQDEIAKAQVEKISQEYVQAVKSGDVPALLRLQSPALVYTAANDRIMSRDQVLTALRSDFGKWSLRSTVIEVCQVFGDTVITAGTEEIQSETGARAGTTTLRRFTNVWRRDGATWVMISRNVATIPSRA